MILSSIEELRLYFPAHAIDSIDPFVGVLDNSEHDFLLEKLGTPLYDALCDWYNQNYSDNIEYIEAQATGYYNRLLLLCQRVIAYDAMSRAIGMHIISINNAGVNIPTADDYGKVDLDAVKTFRQTCVKEAHSAVNRLLQSLEEWTKYAAASEEPDADLVTIVTHWRKSRFYYLAAQMLVPSATVLQTYWNIYESREKFIQMLPDIQYIQEEVIAPAVGEDFCDALVAFSMGDVSTDTESKLAQRTIHKLRKVLAVMLEERTLIINTDKLRRQKAHDEAVRMLQAVLDYIQLHQESYKNIGNLYEALKASPLYIDPEPEVLPEPEVPKFKNNRRDASMFVTPALN